jgi:hypothetical protein
MCPPHELVDVFVLARLKSLKPMIPGVDFQWMNVAPMRNNYLLNPIRP